MKKVFSQEDGTIEIDNGVLRLLEFIKEGDGYMSAIGSTNISDCNIGSKYYEEIYHLPSTLIRKPKTDEELAIERYGNDRYLFAAQRDGFIEGRKSVVGEFHLTREQLEDFAYQCSLRGYHSVGDMIFNVDDIITSLTPSIYPTSIEVDFDGTNYLWETLKANYDK